jgi:hypothetical protein
VISGADYIIGTMNSARNTKLNHSIEFLNIGQFGNSRTVQCVSKIEDPSDGEIPESLIELKKELGSDSLIFAVECPHEPESAVVPKPKESKSKQGTFLFFMFLYFCMQKHNSKDACHGFKNTDSEVFEFISNILENLESCFPEMCLLREFVESYNDNNAGTVEEKTEFDENPKKMLHETTIDSLSTLVKGSPKLNENVDVVLCEESHVTNAKISVYADYGMHQKDAMKDQAISPSKSFTIPNLLVPKSEKQNRNP